MCIYVHMCVYVCIYIHTCIYPHQLKELIIVQRHTVKYEKIFPAKLKEAPHWKRPTITEAERDVYAKSMHIKFNTTPMGRMFNSHCIYTAGLFTKEVFRKDQDNLCRCSYLRTKCSEFQNLGDTSG